MEKYEKKIHGNKAKVDPKKHLDSGYAANMAVTEGRIPPEKGVQRDEQVEYARRFVEENKK